MRINKYLAHATGLSRRAADTAIEQGRVRIDGKIAKPGDQVRDEQRVSLDDSAVHAQTSLQTILFHKPPGYVVSRNGQGSHTIYDILPIQYHHLKPVGRLDKDSSGLLLITNDGNLANQLTHPSQRKIKIYQVTLDKPLAPLHQQMIHDFGVMLEDGPSQLQLQKQNDDAIQWQITMHEGRNRQIRRTFAALGYRVTTLHRTHFGPYAIDGIQPSQIRIIVNK